MRELLTAGLTELGLPTDAIPALERYADMLVEKNKVMNLTAITEPADIATLHFLDSAALLTLADFRNKTVADVGTGAGFPGMPLRILETSIHLTLLDSLNKRIDFLIIAFAVFCLIKFLNGLHRKKEEAPAAPPAPPEPSAEEKLLTEIRDLLKEQK